MQRNRHSHSLAPLLLMEDSHTLTSFSWGSFCSFSPLVFWLVFFNAEKRNRHSHSATYIGPLAAYGSQSVSLSLPFHGEVSLLWCFAGDSSYAQKQGALQLLVFHRLPVLLCLLCRGSSPRNRIPAFCFPLYGEEDVPQPSIFSSEGMIMHLPFSSQQ